MSGKQPLPPCPFCGKRPEPLGLYSSMCDGLVDGQILHATIAMKTEHWFARLKQDKG